jgi:NAD-dependent dihydropyrimidine dehydrogenase PreA subunit
MNPFHPKKPTLRPRLRLVRALHALPHRFSKIRWITQGISFAVLYAVPLLGLARFDLWQGRHLAGRRPVGPVLGVGAVLLGILSFYLLTFVFNAFLGRIFCGFGCPIGQASRLGDDVEIAEKTGLSRFAVIGRYAAFCTGLGLAGTLWLVSPYVLREGSARAVALTLAGVSALSGAVFLHGRFFRWRFCEAYCPIGIYYSAVQTGHGFGVHFDERKNTCKDCGSCELVCPVRLDPRHLDVLKNDVGGIGLDGFAGENHCLSCGECVRACELQLKKEGRALVPLRLGRGFGGLPHRDRLSGSAASAPLPRGAGEEPDEPVVPSDQVAPSRRTDTETVVVARPVPPEAMNGADAAEHERHHPRQPEGAVLDRDDPGARGQGEEVVEGG